MTPSSTSVLIFCVAMILGGCSRPLSQAHAHAKLPQAVSAARCAKNRAAGPVTFLTSFAYAPTTGILDVLTADRLGYFDALCLDVRVQPGSTNAQLVSAGTAQIAGLGDAASAMVAIDHGASIVGIATYGNMSAVELVSMRDGGIASLRQLSGKVVGYKVALAPQVAAMLAKAGAPLDSIKFVSVGFNPVVLSNGAVSAMIGYKSNEPRVLESQGYRIVEWDPERYGVHSTFSVLVANRAWAAGHPTAVEDFLRATLKAYGWIVSSDANLDRALGFAKDLSTSGFDLAAGRARWRFERRMIAASQPVGTAVGYNSDVSWRSDAASLVQARLVRHPPALATAYDNTFFNAVHSGKTLIWPAR